MYPCVDTGYSYHRDYRCIRSYFFYGIWWYRRWIVLRVSHICTFVYMIMCICRIIDIDFPMWFLRPSYDICRDIHVCIFPACSCVDIWYSPFYSPLLPLRFFAPALRPLSFCVFRAYTAFPFLVLFSLVFSCVIRAYTFYFPACMLRFSVLFSEGVFCVRLASCFFDIARGVFSGYVRWDFWISGLLAFSAFPFYRCLMLFCLFFLGVLWVLRLSFPVVFCLCVFHCVFWVARG